MKLGLIGHPVSHSISPLLHGAAMSYAGIDGEYNLIDVPSEEELPERVRQLVSQGYAGWNVTVPHKQAMYRIVDELTNEASKTGAVNTVKVSDTAGGAKLIGHNTDLGGFKADVESFVPGLAGSTVMILGAGGAARAGLWALVEAGVSDIVVTARNFEQAKALASASDRARAVKLEHTYEVSPNVIVNCTPIGLKVKESPEWVTSLLSSGSSGTRYFYDMVYAGTAGGTTCLVQLASENGWNSRDGLGMLVRQAALAFEFWTGVVIPPEIMLLQRT